jgi:serine/threonine protein kinase/Ni2+-binding GTPase involved in maturation of urease and hydrogenase
MEKTLIAKRFFCETRIGGGSLADVWKGIDTNDRTICVIKVFARSGTASIHEQEAYQREVLALRSLKHENVVKVKHDGTTEDGRPYLVLEWAGVPLSEFLTKHIDRWDQFFDAVGEPILNALNAAHLSGIVHRDIKPSNILIDSDGTARLADFNISRIASHLNPQATFATYGTAPYCPPEMDDGSFTRSRDLYAFAVTALACICGKVIKNRQDVLLELQRVKLDERVKAELKNCLSDDPAVRPQYAAELLLRLRDIEQPRRSNAAVKNQTEVGVLLSPTAAKLLEEAAQELGIISESILSQVLGEVCTVKLGKQGQELDIKYELWGPRIALICVVHRDKPDRLFVIHAMRTDPRVYIRILKNAQTPPYRFTDRETMSSANQCRETLSDFERWFAHAQSSQASLTASETFRFYDDLNRILDIRESHIEEESADVKCHNFIKLDSDYCQAEVDLECDLKIGEKLTFNRNSQREVRLHVYNLEGGTLELQILSGQFNWLPIEGLFARDTFYATSGIRREREALVALTTDRCANKNLRNHLVATGLIPFVSKPESLPAPELDDQWQQSAVAAALTAPDGCVVQGPPGTGKTTVIAKIAQEIFKAKPKARILLTSQTNVALDHALKKINELGIGLSSGEVVRIGRETDERVKGAGREVLLERVIDDSVDLIRQKCKAALEIKAQQLNVKVRDAELAEAVTALAEAKKNLEQIDTNVVQAGVVPETNSYAQGQTAEEKRAHIRNGKHVLADAKYHLESAIKNLNLEGNFSDIKVQIAAIVENPNVRQLAKFAGLQRRWIERARGHIQFEELILENARIVASTCIAAGRLKESVQFDLCVIDEASKATITEALVPMVRSKRWMLVGDTKQLAPFVDANFKINDETQSHLNELRARSILTHFEEGLGAVKDDNLRFVMLRNQRRMAPTICNLVSSVFYENKLIPEPNDLRRNDLAIVLDKNNPERRIIWIDTSALAKRRETYLPEMKSYRNLAEAECIGSILARIASNCSLNGGNKTDFLAITGYAPQKLCIDRELRTAWGKLGINQNKFSYETSTIDAIQGQEADVVAFSVTRSNTKNNTGFMKEFNRLNVALSRTKDLLIIVGDADWVRTLTVTEPLRRTLDWIVANKGPKVGILPAIVGSEGNQ